MAKTAVMIRLGDNELAALDELALKQAISRATCATAIVRQRLAGRAVGNGVGESTPRSTRSATDPAQPAKPKKCDHPALYKTASGRCAACEGQS